jgi:hypothetical protein
MLAPYEFSATEYPAYLHARATGPHNARNLLRFLVEANAALERSGRVNLLLELALAGPCLHGGLIHEVVAERAADSARWDRIAYLDLGAGRLLHHMRFAETLARNCGINVRLFRSLAAARNWLTAPLENAA